MRMEEQGMTLDSRTKERINRFFNSLTTEKENFALSLSDLLQCELLITEEKQERIIGIAGLQKKNSFFLVVKSEYQNRGIGQRLTRKVIQKAISSNYDYIALNVFQSNTKAIHVYRKLGFKTVYTSWMSGKRNLFMVLPLNRWGIVFLVTRNLKSIFPFGIRHNLVKWIRAPRSIKRTRTAP